MAYEGFKDAKEAISAPKKFWEGTKKVTGRVGDYSGFYNTGRGIVGAVKAYIFAQPVELADRTAQALSSLPPQFRIFQLKRRVSKLEAELEYAREQYKQDIGRTMPRKDDTTVDRIKNHVNDLGEKLDQYELQDGLDAASDGGKYVAGKAKDVAGAVGKGAADLGSKVAGTAKDLGKGTTDLGSKVAGTVKGFFGRFRRQKDQPELESGTDYSEIIDADYTESPQKDDSDKDPTQE